MRRLTLIRLSLCLAIALFICISASARQEIDSVYGPLPVFELHSGFWTNLHHTLYHEARQRSIASAATRTLTPAEQQAWNAAVSFYAANYADKDLLFSSEMMLLKNQLGDFEDCDELTGRKKKSCDAGLPGKIAFILETAAPVYRAHWWPDHDRANRRWVARVAPLIRQQGLGLSQRLADIYQARWPREKIRVDVTAYANAAGAYTTLDPLRVTISSTDPRNQASAALEVLFHEASHGIAQTVEAAIIRDCKQRDKPIPRDLWHALIFYTTGEVIKPVMASSADARPSAQEDYVPYAVRQGLYQRGWDDYLKLLSKFWQPYLDGKSSFDDAIARMVSSL